MLVAAGGTAQAATTAGPKTYRITQHNLNFDPDVLRIKPGDTVIWTNKETDDTIHSVVQGNGSEINSPDIPPRTTFEVTFTEPFAWKIICRFHPDMFMTVDVAGKPDADATTHAAPSPKEAPKPESGALAGLPPLSRKAG